MINLKIAGTEVRNVVEALKGSGLPAPVSIKEAIPTLTKEQKEILSLLVDLSEKERKVSKTKKRPEKGDSWYQIREEMRQVIQSAIKSGLIKLGIIQRHAVSYGAIPDSKEGWKYYLLPTGNYACWDCGAEVSTKDVAFSVHFAEIPLAGGGEVRHKKVPFCPNCEKEPPDHGIITESVAESIRRDFTVS